MMRFVKLSIGSVKMVVTEKFSMKFNDVLAMVISASRVRLIVEPISSSVNIGRTLSANPMPSFGFGLRQMKN